MPKSKDDRVKSDPNTINKFVRFQGLVSGRLSELAWGRQAAHKLNGSHNKPHSMLCSSRLAPRHPENEQTILQYSGLKHVWHPYTQMKDCRKFPPILIERAKGVKLYDFSGNFYYDTISSWWCNVHGHNHPYIKRAIKRQLDRLEHVHFAGFTHRPAIELAEKLVSITPKNLTKVFYSDDGSTAVETALKMSVQYWKNTGKGGKISFLSLDHGYHGDTIGAMAVSGDSIFNNNFKNLFFRSFKAPSPYCYRCPIGKKPESCEISCLKALEDIFSRYADQIAAFILEPLVMAAGGMIIYPKEYLIKASVLCKKYNVHLILDEVATGFGRTGKMFACDHTGIKPDFMCLSKGLTAGYMAMGVTMATSKVYSAFYDDYEKLKTFYHGHTYTANPLACSAAIAGIDLFQKEHTIKKIQPLIRRLREGLSAFKALSIVGDVRHIGMIGAVELVKDKKLKSVFSLKERIGLKVYEEGLKHSLILRPLGNVIYLFLPLALKLRELDHILYNTYNVIAELSEKGKHDKR